MTAANVTLRRYRQSDEDAAVALWLRTWQAAYPQLDFIARLDWWRQRWRDELLRTADVVIAESAGATIGFVTIDPRTFYLDQIVVAPGSVSRTLPIPGLRENAVGFKTIGEAIWLRNHVLERLDVAATTVDPATRRRARCSR